MNQESCLYALSHVLPHDAIQTDPTEVMCEDPRHGRSGRARARLLPASTEQVQAIVQIAQRYEVPLVCVGGNTGRSAGTLPSEDGQALLIQLSRMQQIRYIDPVNHSVCCEAGVTLSTLNSALEEEDLYFPIELASADQCTIGGNIATNAGGLSTVRYGMTRDYVLGLEVVLADGRLFSDLPGLRKNNNGYAIKQLFIGSEGTLGIITAAHLRCICRPRHHLMARISYQNMADAIDDINCLQHLYQPYITGCEIICAQSLALVRRYIPEQSSALELYPSAPWTLLLELSYTLADLNLPSLFTHTIQQTCAHKAIAPSLITHQSNIQTQLWSVRKQIPVAESRHGRWVKNDIAVSRSQLVAFIQSTQARLIDYDPNIEIACFAHVGDGNLHYNIAIPTHRQNSTFYRDIEMIVSEQIRSFQGSISAEHGIGLTKKHLLPAHLTPVHYALMRTIKQTFDPHNLMNPGKILNKENDLE